MQFKRRLLLFRKEYLNQIFKILLAEIVAYLLGLTIIDHSRIYY